MFLNIQPNTLQTDIQMPNTLVMFSNTFFQTVAERPGCVCGRVRGGVGVMVFDLL